MTLFARTTIRVLVWMLRVELVNDHEGDIDGDNC
ncbi:hypothetical protein FEAC_29450 [Ferrimicrobium acidiphilum DSM 19497]|uniref:Uncharacterized protein n=1 Tax=Ferrimicrobium acidiphilum DSM 19497 TaxID=1121877 RepID=A0A0D8FSU4_9ACTN|nr:hypothetical protein FEAC_29450 [Ferrimicrobium acidiphilum DSM 19497]